MRKNVFLKDMNVEVGAEDARQIEVLAHFPCFGGAQVGVDVTLRCVLSAGRQGDGIPGGGNVRPLQIGRHGSKQARR